MPVNTHSYAISVSSMTIKLSLSVHEQKNCCIKTNQVALKYERSSQRHSSSTSPISHAIHLLQLLNDIRRASTFVRLCCHTNRFLYHCNTTVMFQLCCFPKAILTFLMYIVALTLFLLLALVTGSIKLILFF